MTRFMMPAKRSGRKRALNKFLAENYEVGGVKTKSPPAKKAKASPKGKLAAPSGQPEPTTSGLQEVVNARRRGKAVSKVLTPTETPTSGVETPKSGVDATNSEVDAPKSGVETPNSEVDAPKSCVEAPKSGVDATKSEVDAPKSGVETLKSGVEVPKSGVDTPKSGVETTKSGVETPKSGFETPTSGVETPKSGVESTKSGVKTPTSGVETTKSGVKTPTSGVETTKSGVKTPTSGVETTKSGVKTPTSGVEVPTTGAEIGATTDCLCPPKAKNVKSAEPRDGKTLKPTTSAAEVGNYSKNELSNKAIVDTIVAQKPSNVGNDPEGQGLKPSLVVAEKQSVVVHPNPSEKHEPEASTNSSERSQAEETAKTGTSLGNDAQGEETKDVLTISLQPLDHSWTETMKCAMIRGKARIRLANKDVGSPSDEIGSKNARSVDSTPESSERDKIEASTSKSEIETDVTHEKQLRSPMRKDGSSATKYSSEERSKSAGKDRHSIVLKKGREVKKTMEGGKSCEKFETSTSEKHSDSKSSKNKSSESPSDSKSSKSKISEAPSIPKSNKNHNSEVPSDSKSSKSKDSEGQSGSKSSKSKDSEGQSGSKSSKSKNSEIRSDQKSSKRKNSESRSDSKSSTRKSSESRSDSKSSISKSSESRSDSKSSISKSSAGPSVAKSSKNKNSENSSDSKASKSKSSEKIMSESKSPGTSGEGHKITRPIGTMDMTAIPKIPKLKRIEEKESSTTEKESKKGRSSKEKESRKEKRKPDIKIEIPAKKIRSESIDSSHKHPKPNDKGKTPFSPSDEAQKTSPSKSVRNLMEVDLFANLQQPKKTPSPRKRKDSYNERQKAVPISEAVKSPQSKSPQSKSPDSRTVERRTSVESKIESPAPMSYKPKKNWLEMAANENYTAPPQPTFAGDNPWMPNRKDLVECGRVSNVLSPERQGRPTDPRLAGATYAYDRRLSAEERQQKLESIATSEKIQRLALSVFGEADKAEERRKESEITAQHDTRIEQKPIMSPSRITPTTNVLPCWPQTPPRPSPRRNEPIPSPTTSRVPTRDGEYVNSPHGFADSRTVSFQATKKAGPYKRLSTDRDTRDMAITPHSLLLPSPASSSQMIGPPRGPSVTPTILPLIDMISQSSQIKTLTAPKKRTETLDPSAPPIPLALLPRTKAAEPTVPLDVVDTTRLSSQSRATSQDRWTMDDEGLEDISSSSSGSPSYLGRRSCSPQPIFQDFSSDKEINKKPPIDQSRDPIPRGFMSRDSRLPDPPPRDSRLPDPTPRDSRLPDPPPRDSRLPDPPPLESRLPDPPPRDSRLPDPPPRDSRLPDPPQRDSRLPDPTPRDSRLPDPTPRDSRLPDPPPRDSPLPDPTPRGSLLPDPPPRGSLLPDPPQRGSLLPDPTPRDSLLPDPPPRDSLLPNPTPRDLISRYSRSRDQNDSRELQENRKNLRVKESNREISSERPTFDGSRESRDLNSPRDAVRRDCDDSGNSDKHSQRETDRKWSFDRSRDTTSLRESRDVTSCDRSDSNELSEKSNLGTSRSGPWFDRSRDLVGLDRTNSGKSSSENTFSDRDLQMTSNSRYWTPRPESPICSSSSLDKEQPYIAIPVVSTSSCGSDAKIPVVSAFGFGSHAKIPVVSDFSCGSDAKIPVVSAFGFASDAAIPVVSASSSERGEIKVEPPYVGGCMVDRTPVDGPTGTLEIKMEVDESSNYWDTHSMSGSKRSRSATPCSEIATPSDQGTGFEIKVEPMETEESGVKNDVASDRATPCSSTGDLSTATPPQQFPKKSDSVESLAKIPEIQKSVVKQEQIQEKSISLTSNLTHDKHGLVDWDQISDRMNNFRDFNKTLMYNGAIGLKEIDNPMLYVDDTADTADPPDRDDGFVTVYKSDPRIALSRRSKSSDEISAQKRDKVYVTTNCPKAMTKRRNDIYVTQKTDFRCQVEKCRNLFDIGYGTIYIHGLGQAVNRAIELGLKLRHEWSNALEMSVHTHSVTSEDEFFTLCEEEPVTKCVDRNRTAVHITLSLLNRRMKLS